MHRINLRWRGWLWTLVVGLVMLARIADAGNDPQAPAELLTPASDTRALRVLPTYPASASVQLMTLLSLVPTCPNWWSNWGMPIW